MSTIGIEAVEDLGMDRIGCLEPFLAIGIPSLGREFLLLRSVQVEECFGNGITTHKLVLLDERLTHVELTTLRSPN